MSEQAIAKARAIQGLVKMEGWHILESELRREIAQAVEELRDIEISGRPLQDIGADFVEKQKLIDGLSRTLEIARELQQPLEEATNET